MRVLFLDDDEGVSRSVETALRRKGHAVDTANLGSDALALMENTAYDLVVLDVELPDMDGYQVARRMKSDQIETPIIMQAGYAGQDLTDDAETLEIQGFLAKPFSIHNLLKCMESVISPSDGAGHGPAAADDPVSPSPVADPSPEPAADPPRQTAPSAPQELPANGSNERRKFERTPTVEAAVITEDDKMIACVILDISPGGAHVKLPEPDQSCPKMFCMKSLDDRERYCEVRWRSGANVGVKFI